MIELMSKLIGWADSAITCQDCLLGSTATRKAIDRSFLWRGKDKHIPIVIVGMSPAYCEDRTGIPLVGGWELATSRCGQCQRMSTYTDSYGGQQAGCFDYFLGNKSSYKGHEVKCQFPEGDPCRWASTEEYAKRLPGIVPAMCGLPGIFKPTTAGQLLDKMLQRAGIVRASESEYWEEKCRICDLNMDVPEPNCTVINVVLCRSMDSKGENRDPSKEEIRTCRPRIHEYLRLIHPDVVVTLGAVATAEYIEPFMKFRDVIRRRHTSLFGPDILPLYHPSYYLYRWEEIDTAKEIEADEESLKELLL